MNAATETQLLTHPAAIDLALALAMELGVPDHRTTMDGDMLDRPHLKRAERLMARAARSE
jgi:citrate lyase beta subunit